jgi:hypothetical protein
MSDPISEDDTTIFPTAETNTYTFSGVTTVIVFTTWLDALSAQVDGITIVGSTGTTRTTITTTEGLDETPTTGTTTTTITLTDTPTTTTEPPATSTDPTAPVTVTIYSPLPTQADISSGGGGGGGGLSSGTKAGIGVGVALGSILLVAVGGIFWFRRRKRRMEDVLRETPVIAPTLGAKEPPYEVDATERRVFELAGKGVAVNRAMENDRYELDT